MSLDEDRLKVSPDLSKEVGEKKTVLYRVYARSPLWQTYGK